MKPQYVEGRTVIVRECPVHGCSEMLEANSHAGQVKALHSHLSEHDWKEKQRFM